MTLVFVGKASDFHMCERKFPYKPFHHQQRVRPLDCVMIEVCMGGNHNVDRDLWKLMREPFSPSAGRIVTPGIDKHGRAFRRCEFKGRMAIELSLHGTGRFGVPAFALYCDQPVVVFGEGGRRANLRLVRKR